MPIVGENIGNVHIKVYETPTGETLFYLEADNNNVESVLNYIGNYLKKY